MTSTTKTLWGGYYYETNGRTYWKTGENWDTERVEISEAEYNEAMADRQDYYDHRDIYDNDEQLLWDIEMEAAIEEETGNPMTSAVEMDPVAAVVAHIQREMFGLVRRDADAVANGWDPHEYPENGHIWQEAERQLLAASGDEELDDDTYADLVDAIADILPDPEDMDEEEEE